MKKLSIVILTLICLSSMALTAYADWSTIPVGRSSNTAFTVMPLSFNHYSLESGDTYDIVEAQGETIPINGVNEQYLFSVTDGGVDVYYYSTRTFKRFDDGTVNGSDTRLVSALDNTVGITSISAPSVWAFDTSVRDRNMPYITFDDTWRFMSVDIVYTYKVVNRNTRQIIENSVSIPVLGANNTILVLPVTVVAQMRTDAGLVSGDNNLVVYDYTITFNIQATATTARDHTYTINYTNRNTLFVDNGQNNPFSSAIEYNQSITGDKVVATDFNFTKWLGTAFGFLETPLFGNFTIGGLLSVVLSISLLMAFLRIFSGG